MVYLKGIPELYRTPIPEVHWLIGNEYKPRQMLFISYLGEDDLTTHDTFHEGWEGNNFLYNHRITLA